MQLVVFSVVGFEWVIGGGVHVHVVHHPVDGGIRPNNFTDESEVFRVYWNCVVFDHD